MSQKAIVLVYTFWVWVAKLSCLAQGREEGGSGVTLDKEAYEKSVMYWDSHAAILAGQKPSGE